MEKTYEAAKQDEPNKGPNAAANAKPRRKKLRVRLMLVREGRAEMALAISNPSAAFKLLVKEMKGADREQLWRIDLDARNNVLGFELVSMGTVTMSLLHPREIFKGALLNNAVSIILAHNHPSQVCDPSKEDKAVTQRIKQVGELMGVPLADHIIIADGDYFSFMEKRLL